MIMKKIENSIPNKEIIVSFFLRKAKEAYYENLDEKNVSDNKSFWKTVEPSLAEKLNVRGWINLSENCEIVKTEQGTAEVFNHFFI